MASFAERNVRIDFKRRLTLGGSKKNPNHIWKIADTLFEGNVRGNISDVNLAAPIIDVWRRTNLSEAVFLGIFFQYHYDTDFLKNFKDVIVFYYYQAFRKCVG